jgi:hypothetical protein
MGIGFRGFGGACLPRPRARPATPVTALASAFNGRF